MAYTSVIPVRRLDRTVDYVQNKEKTTPKSLEEAVDYAANRDKTESACFETGLGCTTTSAFEDMRLNTLRWHKETGVQGYHLVQSFAEGEVTPELAHQIGVEFAEQLLHGKYQAIVEVDDYIAEFVVEGNNERAFISMNTQNIVRLEVDDGNGIQVIDIDSGKPFAIVLPLNVGNICFYDTNGNVVEYLRQQL